MDDTIEALAEARAQMESAHQRQLASIKERNRMNDVVAHAQELAREASARYHSMKRRLYAAGAVDMDGNEPGKEGTKVA